MHGILKTTYTSIESDNYEYNILNLYLFIKILNKRLHFRITYIFEFNISVD